MKNFLFLALLFIPLILSAQEVEFSIEGVILKPGNAKAAYLLIRGERLVKTEIHDGKFKLEGKSDLLGRMYKAGILFIDEREDISFEEVTAKFKEMVWVPGREPFLKSLALEEIQMEIEEPGKASTAKINKGVLTKQMIESGAATRGGYINGFIKEHPDSPVSFEKIKDSIRYYEVWGSKAQATFGSLAEMFNSLSDRLKNSEDGVALKKKIDQLGTSL